MPIEQKGVALQDLGAYGVGLTVTVVSAVLTAPVIPIPFNLLISFGLGGTAWYGARKLLDPWTDAEREERRTVRDYKVILDGIAAIAKRTAEAGDRGGLGSEVSKHLASIARMIKMILERYRLRRDFAGASKTLTVLQMFDEILSHYVRVKRNELFMDNVQADKEIAETEGHVMPIVERALEELGRTLDSGESVDMDIHKGTLEDMLRSLDLVRSLIDKKDSLPHKEGSDDA